MTTDDPTPEEVADLFGQLSPKDQRRTVDQLRRDVERTARRDAELARRAQRSNT